MDFARINLRHDADQGATWDVEYDGEVLECNGEPIQIHILGLDSRKAKRAGAKMVKRMNAKTKGKKDTSKMTVDQIVEAVTDTEENQAAFYAELTTGWENVTYIEDEDFDNPEVEPKPLEFNYENAKKLYMTRPWIMEGLDAFLADKGNFSKRN